MANLKLQNLYKMYDQGNGKKDGVYAVNKIRLYTPPFMFTITSIFVLRLKM